MLVDHANRKPLQRPHLTLAIDVVSRVVLGFYVSFDPRSAMSIASFLDHCIQNKTVHLAEVHDDLFWREPADGSSRHAGLKQSLLFDAAFAK